jgi:methyl-accepting chemotaxis protein
MRVIDSLSLGEKITLVAMAPLAAFLAMAVLGIRSNIHKAGFSDTLSKNVVFIKSASKLVHQFQRERGVSAGFLNGGMALSDVEKQRQGTDAAVPAFAEALEPSSIAGERRSRLAEKLKSLADLRGQVNARALAAPEAAKRYSSIIAELLLAELDASTVDDVAGVTRRINSLYLMESAKENAGRLRATGTAMLAANSPIAVGDLSMVVGLKAGVEQIAQLPALEISPESKASLRAFLAADDWKSVQKSFESLAGRWDKGSFGLNPKDFFASATRSIDALAQIIFAETEVIDRRISQARSEAIRELWFLCSALLFGAGGLAMLLFLMIRSITRPMNHAIEQLGLSANHVSDESGDLRAASEKMAAGSTESAASLQETAASLEEISAMVRKNSEHAVTASRTSEDGRLGAEKGREAVQEMTRSIQEIQVSNGRIMACIQDSNRKMADVVNVILEIGNKTKVINDIVFQTKLLSFNASVEAARAGEHGKGFAVVAEEVGNLAQMSGNAAQEIREMLDSSAKRVSAVIDGTRGEVEKLIEEDQRLVERGVLMVKSCEDTFNELVARVSAVSEVVAEISTACGEQASGVQEINTAIAQLDQVTQENAGSSEKASRAAASLAEQSGVLYDIVRQLAQTVRGRRAIVEGPSSSLEDHRDGHDSALERAA